MALMLDSLLLQPSDFKEFSDITKTLVNDVPKMELYIRESQVSEIRAFIGDELYLKMILDYDETNQTFTDANYTNLWFGVDYTVGTVTKRLHGLKAAHIYYSLSRIIEGANFNTGRFGNKDINNENSQSNTHAMIRAKVNAARSQGLIYQNEAKDYLDQNNSTYPEWPDSNQRPIRTGIKMMKV